LRQAEADDYMKKPKIKYPDSFASTSSPEQREQMNLILRTNQKYRPNTRGNRGI